MKPTAALTLLAVALAGCEQPDQLLRFSVDEGDPVSRTVAPGAATTLSTPAGAAVRFAAGSFASPTLVTLRRTTPPPGLGPSGILASSAFGVEPTGLALAAPAVVELRFNPLASPRDAWLASVVVVAGGSVEELGGTRVDLGSGLAEAAVDRLGTLAVVVPDTLAVVRARRSLPRPGSSAPAPTTLLEKGTDSLRVECGPSPGRCVGLALEVSDNLSGQVQDAAAVFPRVSGVLRIRGDAVEGRIDVVASIRLLMHSGTSAENLPFTARIEPTAAGAQGTLVSEDAFQITLEGVRQLVGGGEAAGVRSRSGDSLETLVITKEAGAGRMTLSRPVQVRMANGRLDTGYVRLTVPVEVFQ